MSKKYRLNMDVLKKNHSWLGRDYLNGSIVYAFYGATYGCISPSGMAFTDDPYGLCPFFELPYVCVEAVEE